VNFISRKFGYSKINKKEWHQNGRLFQKAGTLGTSTFSNNVCKKFFLLINFAYFAIFYCHPNSLYLFMIIFYHLNNWNSHWNQKMCTSSSRPRVRRPDWTNWNGTWHGSVGHCPWWLFPKNCPKWTRAEACWATTTAIAYTVTAAISPYSHYHLHGFGTGTTCNSGT
jgi:hypothetical protein